MRNNKYLRAWFWAVSRGIVSADTWQPWADSMITQMDVPPAWICDMSVATDNGYELRRKLVDHLKVWDAKDIYVTHGDLAISLDYLLYLKNTERFRSTKYLQKLLERAAASPHEMLIGKQADFQAMKEEYAQAIARGDECVVREKALELFARCFPWIATYYSMIHDPPEQVAREITNAMEAGEDQ